MTLDDTLTMRTGLDWQEGDPAYRALYISPDWVKYVLDKPMVAAAGQRSSTIARAARTCCRPSCNRRRA